MDYSVKVGVGVFVIKDNKILLGKRKSSHGEGTWGLPGGHLEFKESLEDCAWRETKEETNLEIINPQFLTLTQDIFETKHYITIFMKSIEFSGELKLLEIDKFEKWDWFDWVDLPEPLFLPLKNLKEKGFNPID